METIFDNILQDALSYELLSLTIDSNICNDTCIRYSASLPPQIIGFRAPPSRFHTIWRNPSVLDNECFETFMIMITGVVTLKLTTIDFFPNSIQKNRNDGGMWNRTKRLRHILAAVPDQRKKKQRG